MTTTQPGAHWLNLFDAETGDPIAHVCRCPIAADHDGTGRLEQKPPANDEQQRREAS